MCNLKAVFTKTELYTIVAKLATSHYVSSSNEDSSVVIKLNLVQKFSSKGVSAVKSICSI